MAAAFAAEYHEIRYLVGGLAALHGADIGGPGFFTFSDVSKKTFRRDLSDGFTGDEGR